MISVQKWPYLVICRVKPSSWSILITHGQPLRTLKAKNTNRKNIVTITLLGIKLRFTLAWFQAQDIQILGPKINIFCHYKLPPCTDRPFLLYLIHKHSNRRKKLGILMCLCNNSNLRSQNLKIAISARYSKRVRQILDILEENIQIFHRNHQELGGVGEMDFFSRLWKSHFGRFWREKFFDFKTFFSCELPMVYTIMVHNRFHFHPSNTWSCAALCLGGQNHCFQA